MCERAAEERLLLIGIWPYRERGPHANPDADVSFEDMNEGVEEIYAVEK